MKWLRKFMYDKYGMDQLNMALLWGGIILSLFSWLIPNHLIRLLIMYIPVVLCLFRMLSKNYEARRRENDAFVLKIYPWQKKWNKFMARLKGSRTHKYFKCPNCKRELRVPRGKGKIEITCPRCSVKFDAKS
ncbi:MAG: hypothetical protein IKL88_06640 [Erysipelotrichales bacterium]|nr:hypothetical protein [Erysipelotrichales bacterium]